MWNAVAWDGSNSVFAEERMILLRCDFSRLFLAFLSSRFQSLLSTWTAGFLWQRRSIPLARCTTTIWTSSRGKYGSRLIRPTWMVLPWLKTKKTIYVGWMNIYNIYSYFLEVFTHGHLVQKRWLAPFLSGGIQQLAPVRRDQVDPRCRFSSCGSAPGGANGMATGCFFSCFERWFPGTSPG